MSDFSNSCLFKSNHPFEIFMHTFYFFIFYYFQSVEGHPQSSSVNAVEEDEADEVADQLSQVPTFH